MDIAQCIADLSEAEAKEALLEIIHRGASAVHFLDECQGKRSFPVESYEAAILFNILACKDSRSGLEEINHEGD